jgi:hypothetical protein
MRKKITALAAAGILLFAACSGGDDTASDAAEDDGGGESNATGNGGDSEAGAFCDGAAEVFQPTGDLDPEAQLAQAEALEPPSEIADDWRTLVQGSLEATADLDPNDPDAQAEFQEQYQELLAASTNVYTYLGEECDMEGFAPPASDPTAGTTPTTAGS